MLIALRKDGAEEISSTQPETGIELRDKGDS